MGCRHLIIVTLLCLRLAGVPIPEAHTHAELSGEALAKHTAQHHSQTVPLDDWHWHWMLLGESDETLSLERADSDLWDAERWCEREVESRQLTFETCSLQSLVVTSLPPPRWRSLGRAESRGGPSRLRDLLCVRTL